MNNKIENVKKYIAKLKNEENKKQFAKELYDASEFENLNPTIYYDLKNHKLCCEPLPKDTIIPNTIFIVRLLANIDLDKMSDEEYNSYIENLIKEFENINYFVYYDEDGENTTLI